MGLFQEIKYKMNKPIQSSSESYIKKSDNDGIGSYENYKNKKRSKFSKTITQMFKVGVLVYISGFVLDGSIGGFRKTNESIGRETIFGDIIFPE